MAQWGLSRQKQRKTIKMSLGNNNNNNNNEVESDINNNCALKYSFGL